MSNAKTIASALGVGTLGVIGVVLVFLLVVAISTAITAVFVAAVWNWFGVHNLFNAGTLGFWPVVGVAVILNFIRGVLFRST